MYTTNVNTIAKSQKLTRDVLIREILPEHNASIYFKEKKKELLSDLGCVSSKFDIDERVVIYCFIRLWQTGLVKNFDFWKSYNDNRFDVVHIYIKEYYREIDELQQRLWQE